MPKGVHHRSEGQTGVCARAVCRRPFPMSQPNRLYCSSRCRYLEYKRRELARMVGQALMALGSKVSQSQDLFAGQPV